MHDTTPFAALKKRYGLVSVHFDQGAIGHEKRKSTELLADSLTAAPLRERIGVMRVPDGWVSGTPPLRGKDATGAFRTRGAEVYPPELCEQLARVLLESRAGGDSTTALANAKHEMTAAVNNALTSRGKALKGTKRVALEADLTTEPLANGTPDTNTPGVSNYKRGDRVEVYWEGEKDWFPGRVVNIGTSRVRVADKQVTVPDIQVKYDDGKLCTHSLHNNSGIRLDTSCVTISRVEQWIVASSRHTRKLSE